MLCEAAIKHSSALSVAMLNAHNDNASKVDDHWVEMILFL